MLIISLRVAISEMGNLEKSLSKIALSIHSHPTEQIIKVKGCKAIEFKNKSITGNDKNCNIKVNHN